MAYTGVWKTVRLRETFLNIMADLDNAVVWMVSIRLLISKSSCLCTNPLVTATNPPIINGIPVTSTFFIYLARSSSLSFYSLFFKFSSTVSLDTKIHNSARSLFLLIIFRSVRLPEIRWSVFISESQRSLCVLFAGSNINIIIIIIIIEIWTSSECSLRLLWTNALLKGLIWSLICFC